MIEFFYASALLFLALFSLIRLVDAGFSIATVEQASFFAARSHLLDEEGKNLGKKSTEHFSRAMQLQMSFDWAGVEENPKARVRHNSGIKVDGETPIPLRSTE